jgi:hypothetical protein
MSSIQRAFDRKSPSRAGFAGDINTAGCIERDTPAAIIVAPAERACRDQAAIGFDLGKKRVEPAI